MKKFTKRSALLLAVVLVVLGTLGGTLAYLQAKTGSITNTMKMAQVTTEIKEELENLTKTIQIENTGKSPVYARLRLSLSGVSASDVKICTDASQKSEDKVNIIPAAGWAADGAAGPDSYWYYTKALPEGQTTAASMTVYVGTGIQKDLPANFQVFVYQESVLADPETYTTAAQIAPLF